MDGGDQASLYKGEIGRLITVGTPHYGASPAGLLAVRALFEISSVIPRDNWVCSTAQMNQLAFGSTFLLSLHDSWTVFQSNSSFRMSPANMLFIAGTQSDSGRFECNGEGCDDGLVQISSAVLPSTSSDRIRYVPYKHSLQIKLPLRERAVQTIDNTNHKVFQIIKEFLTTGTVSPQCCGTGTVDYNPPHLRGDVTKQEGLLVLRTVDGNTGKPLIGFPAPQIWSFTPRVWPYSYRHQANTATGTLTLWGLEASTYEIEVRRRSIQRGVVKGLQIQSARPTVPEPVQVR